jgi:hypothetical protein
LNCHEKCREVAPKACTKYKSSGPHQRDSTGGGGELAGGQRPGAGHHPEADNYYEYNRTQRQAESTNIIYQVSRQCRMSVNFEHGNTVPGTAI